MDVSQSAAVEHSNGDCKGMETDLRATTSSLERPYLQNPTTDEKFKDKRGDGVDRVIPVPVEKTVPPANSEGTGGDCKGMETDLRDTANPQEKPSLQSPTTDEKFNDKRSDEFGSVDLVPVEKDNPPANSEGTEDFREEDKAPETSPSVNEDNRMHDGLEPQHKEETLDANEAEGKAGEGDCKGVETDSGGISFSQESPSPQSRSADEKIIDKSPSPQSRTADEKIIDEGPSPQSRTRDEKIIDKRSDKIDDPGPAPTANPEGTGFLGGNGKFFVLMVTAVIFAYLGHIFNSESLPEKKDLRQIDIFLREMDRVKAQFPNQRLELWRRSHIHLVKHLQTTHPTEPVSLILTAGHGAEKTLFCLAKGIATAFSSALNASVLHIDGASKANQDKNQVKMDIDRQLQGAFEGNKHVAIIHRFEELPPGSTLIFYRYCDHENAAYKGVSLIFTVLLEEEEEIPTQLGLDVVEEMVDDLLQRKFLTFRDPIAFDKMDRDKYGGLWSRIAHLILPVVAEERTERGEC